MRKRTSIIWELPSEQFKKIVAKSNSLAEITRYFGFCISSSNYNALRQRLDKDGIDYSHIKLGMGSNKNRKFPNRAIPLEEVMIKGSTYNRTNLKRRLLKNGMLNNKCDICGQEEIWNNQKLVMVLDHINGINNDHRGENLQMLCPNCNSQQKTFAGRQNKKRYNCKKCGIKITKKFKNSICKSCR